MALKEKKVVKNKQKMGFFRGGMRSTDDGMPMNPSPLSAREPFPRMFMLGFYDTPAAQGIS